MPILIDKEKMRVCYKHHNTTFLSNLMHIEFPHCTASIVDENSPCFDGFSDLELKLLYESLSGSKYTNYPNREVLLANVVKLCQMVPESVLNGFELSLQAEYIDREDSGIYKYVPGSNVPSKQQDLYTHSALVAGAGFTPVLTPTRTASAAPASYTQAASVPKAAPVPRTSAPRSEAVSNEAPKSGSKTGRVWEIAEKLHEDYYAVHQCAPDFKVLRKEIVAACEAEGINSSTASVQYGKWRHTKHG